MVQCNMLPAGTRACISDVSSLNLAARTGRQVFRRSVGAEERLMLTFAMSEDASVRRAVLRPIAGLLRASVWLSISSKKPIPKEIDHRKVAVLMPMVNK